MSDQTGKEPSDARSEASTEAASPQPSEREHARSQAEMDVDDAIGRSDDPK